jgi:16S rRNA U516 pseudouridylate synthase RsuA-like enzyme
MAAKQFLESKYLKCGDVYASHKDVFWTLIAGVELDFAEQELSKADRMNGLTFKGVVSIGKDAVLRRMFGTQDSGWMPMVRERFFPFMLKNGKWEIGERVHLFDQMEKPPSCKDIPQEIREAMP